MKISIDMIKKLEGYSELGKILLASNCTTLEELYNKCDIINQPVKLRAYNQIMNIFLFEFMTPSQYTKFAEYCYIEFSKFTEGKLKDYQLECMNKTREILNNNKITKIIRDYCYDLEYITDSSVGYITSNGITGLAMDNITKFLAVVIRLYLGIERQDNLRSESIAMLDQIILFSNRNGLNTKEIIHKIYIYAIKLMSEGC